MTWASCVFNGRNETKIFAVVVEPELLLYSSDGTRVTDVIVSKSLASRSLSYSFRRI